MTVIYVDRDNDNSYSHNFKAPAGSANLNREVLFPLAEKQTPAYGESAGLAQTTTPRWAGRCR